MAARKLPKGGFHANPGAETQFLRALKKVGRVSGHIVEAHVDGHTIRSPDGLKAALEAYSKLLDPWARKRAAEMVRRISQANRKEMKKKSQEIGEQLKLNVAAGEVGEAAAKLMAEHVNEIKSIPLKAAERAQKLSMAAVYEGKRADEVAEELARSTKVSESTAALIARTEVAKANASINQARSVAVGSRQYRWHNSGDGAVRDSHRIYRGKKLEGMVFSWDSPPTLDDGTTGHPGTFPNCRCYAEPIFDT
jgi:SPP1 gp7 family putative phage head morphogenesis protein